MGGDSTHCGQLAYARFRRQAEGAMTPCVRPPHHKGKHVYGLLVGNAIQYYEEINRAELKPVMHVDLRRNHSFDEEDIAATWQWLRKDI